MSSDFFELYKHPLWQKKRLEIMERDGFQCVECGSNDTILNVHHSYYRRGAKPWEYDDDDLHTLCATCHKNRESAKTCLLRLFGRLCLYRQDQIIGFSAGFLMMEDGKSIDCRGNHGLMQGLCSAWDVELESLNSVCPTGESVSFDMMQDLQFEAAKLEDPQPGLLSLIS